MPTRQGSGVAVGLAGVGEDPVDDDLRRPRYPCSASDVSVRRASARTTRSGVRTRRTVVLSARRMACTSTQLRVPASQRLEDGDPGQRQPGGRRGGRPQPAEQAALGGQQPVEVPGERLGQGQQAQRLGGGGAVDDDQVPQPRLDLGRAARAGPAPPRRRAARSAPRRPPGRRRPRRGRRPGSPGPRATTDGPRRRALTCERVQARLDLDRLLGAARGVEVDPEGVAEGVRRVGGHDQRLDAGTGGLDGGGRGGGRLADTALAGEQENRMDGRHPGAASPRRASSAPSARCR